MLRGRRLTTVAAVASAVCVSAALATPLVSASDAEPVTTPTSASSTSPDPATSPTAAPSPAPSPSPDPSLTPSPSLSPTPTASSSASSSASSTTSTAEPSTAIMERYIVVTDNDAAAYDVKARAVALGASVDTTLIGAVDGFAAEMTDEQLDEVEQLPGVDYVEPDLRITLDAPGSAIRTDAACTVNSLGRMDDGSTSSLPIGFDVNWFGTSYDALYINNNGGVVLDDGRGVFTSYRGIDLSTTIRPLILPLFTDMDTRNVATSPVTYGQISNFGGVSGAKAFCVNWVNVGEYSQSAAKFSAQLVIIDQGSGNVDIEFNYNTVGQPTSTSNGTFVIGYADPANRGNSWVNVRSTDSTLPYIDGGASALNAHQDGGTGVEGRFTREIRPGAAPTASPTPSPTPTPTSTTSCGVTTPPGTYGCAPWGLDRIDTRTRTYDQLYTPAGDASGVVAYVVDTGIRQSHTEFTGRMGAYQYDAVDNDTLPQDCHGHGTHVGGTMAGTNYGVARQATVVGVRVLDCYGSGYTSDVVAGLNWIAANHANYYSGQRGVANMSLGGGASKTLDDAVQAVINAGVPVVVAAGNDNFDAQYYSPARVADAITVAASDSSDTRAWFSNYGSIVDIFAPGVSVLSAGIASDTATASYSGTSMASPHVAGAAAIYLALNPSAPPSAVASALGAAATTDVISDPQGTVNRLLYARAFDPYSAPSTPPSAPIGGGAPAASGGGAGGGSIDDGGGGGALQEITEVRPAFGPVTGGNVVAIIGYGFTGASSVTIGGRPAGFKVINDATVEVTMPAADGPGSADVAVNLSATRGRAFAPGGYVYRAVSATASAPVSSAPSSGDASPTDTTTASSPTPAAASLLGFKPNSAVLTPSVKAKLERIAASVEGKSVTGTVITYRDKRGSAKSTKAAQARARNVVRYLESLGVDGEFSIAVRKGATAAQRRGVLVRLSADPQARAITDSSRVSSLLVKYRKGSEATTAGLPLTVAGSLGLGMYRLDFARPVTVPQAQRVAAQLTRDRRVEFAEPDGLVTTSFSR